MHRLPDCMTAEEIRIAMLDVPWHAVTGLSFESFVS